MFEPLKNLLTDSLKRRSTQMGIRAAVVLEACRDGLEFLFPTALVFKITPSSFKDRVITLSVEGAFAAQEVKIRANSLIVLLNERLGVGTVNKIRIKLARQE